MEFFRAILKNLRASSLIRLFGCLLLLAYFGQSFVVTQHVARHFGEKISASHNVSTVSDRDCAICDAAHVAPQITKTVTNVQVATVVIPAPALSPIFHSENAILLPFGARAPPVVQI